MQKALNRRSFLGLGAALGGAWCLDQAAYAAPPDEDSSVFVFSRFRFKDRQASPDDWNILPVGDENLLAHVREVTNLRISRKQWRERVVGIEKSTQLYARPFLFMTGEVGFSFTRDEASALSEYFKRGGFLLADDCIDEAEGPRHFYEAFVREIKSVLPGMEMKPIPHDHQIYHCFYSMPHGSPAWSNVPRRLLDRYPDLGLFLDGRIVCFLTANDLHCSWARRHEWGIATYPEALKMGTNIIIYALTH